MMKEYFEPQDTISQKSPGSIDPYGPVKTRTKHDIEIQGVYQLVALVGTFVVIVTIISQR